MRTASQSKAFRSNPTTTLPITTFFAVTTDQTYCRLFCASLMQALCDTLRLNARVRWVSLTSRTATTGFCSGLCGGVQPGIGLSQIQQVPEPNPVWLMWTHARHVKLLLHAATDVAVFSFFMLRGLMPHRLLRLHVHLISRSTVRTASLNSCLHLISLEGLCLHAGRPLSLPQQQTSWAPCSGPKERGRRTRAWLILS
jgi:hypothetical protein